MLWVRGHTIIAEAVLAVQFLQLLAVYFRYHSAPRLIHLAVSAMPLTITYFLILWDGAVMVHCHSLVCRVLANVAVWGIAAYAGFFLLGFKDYYVGFCTAYLAAGLGVGYVSVALIDGLLTDSADNFSPRLSHCSGRSPFRSWRSCLWLVWWLPFQVSLEETRGTKRREGTAREHRCCRRTPRLMHASEARLADFINDILV